MSNATNSVVLKGNVANDPITKEFTYDGNASTVVKFDLAVQRYYKGNKDVFFMPCETWGKEAENLSKMVSKGDPLLVHGSLKVDKWEKDGVKHTKFILVIDSFERLFRSPNTGNYNSEGGEPATTNEGANVKDGSVDTSEVEIPLSVGGDDIPF